MSCLTCGFRQSQGQQDQRCPGVATGPGLLALEKRWGRRLCNTAAPQGKCEPPWIVSDTHYLLK